MRKVKLQRGAWALVHHLEFPYALLGRVSLVNKDDGYIHFEYATPYHCQIGELICCVADSDAVEIQRQITDLTERYKKAHATLEQTMERMRSHTDLGRLDPRS